ncbi:MAG: hypothetical protein IMZ53_02850 [Thermoplasmata archaeon]|nr:hypothetical protein [Thermoplasmata archaeon]
MGDKTTNKFNSLLKPEYTPDTHRLFVGGRYGQDIFDAIDAGIKDGSVSEFEVDTFNGFLVEEDSSVDMEFRPLVGQ